MGSKRGSGEARRRGSTSPESQKVHLTSLSRIAEVAVPGAIPLFEIPGWRELYGIRAGITELHFEGWSDEIADRCLEAWRDLPRNVTGEHRTLAIRLLFLQTSRSAA